MSAGQVIVMDLQVTINATAWGGLACKPAQKKGVLEQLCMERVEI